MNDDLERSLLHKYPAIFGEDPAQPNLPTRWGVECGDGWYNLLENLCHDIQAYINTEHVQQVTFIQVKEKFGELRIYYTLVDNYVDDLVKETARKSKLTCEYCGEPGKHQQTSSGWVKTVCSDCLTVVDAE
ncbi:TPA: hypothetical protein U8251_002854 [Pseudomonas putida]|nr:hypothetical protein [Pseudomonas putida]